jgi:hypothetical protein
MRFLAGARVPARPRMRWLVVGLAVLLGAVATGSALASTGSVQRASVGHRASTDAVVVFELDVTASVPDEFRTQATHAFGRSLYRRFKRGDGPTRTFLRVINHNSGSDANLKGSWRVPTLPDEHRCGKNPYDSDCLVKLIRDIRFAKQQEGAIQRTIERQHFRAQRAGTTILGALAAAADTLAHRQGDKWLVVASDLRPSDAVPPAPTVRLDGVRVQVLFSCREPIAVCQKRKMRWAGAFGQYGARSVDFLSMAEADQILTPVNERNQ